MDIAVHAQGMAHNCTPAFAELVLEVPTRLANNYDFQRRIILEIVHASGMSQIDARPETTQMLYNVANRLLTTATPQSFLMQAEATRRIVQAVVHAHNIALTVPTEAERLMAAVRPLTNSALPTGPAELRILEGRLTEAQSTIRSVAWSYN
jgi:hypothetical protein